MTSPSTFEFIIRCLIEADVCRSQSWPWWITRMGYYYTEQQQGKRLVFVAVSEESIIGYVSLHFISHDPVFSSRSIPEIVDLNVFEPYHNKGIGKALIKACEENARRIGWAIIGIGVELEPQYAAARHLYPKLGYTPIGGVSQTEIWALYKKLD